MSSRAPAAYFAAGLAGMAVFFALPPGLAKHLAFYPLFGLSAAAAILAGVVLHRPPHRLPWFLFAAGMLLFALGDVLFGVYEHLLHESPFPSAADYLYLLGYPAVALGLWLLVRTRSAGPEWGSVLDATILTVALAVPAWVFLMARYTGDPTLSAYEKFFALAYTLGDLLLLAVASRLVFGGGRRTLSYDLIGLSVFCGLCADASYGALQLQGVYATGNATDAGQILFYLLWGAAALHPSMRRVSEPEPEAAPKLTPLRLAALGAASVGAPIVLAFRSSEIAVAGSGLLFFLVVARLAGIVGKHERAVERESRLRASAGTLVAATSPEEIHEAAVETAVAFAGGAAARATLLVDGRAVAAAGESADGASLAFPLLVHDESHGTLEVATATPLELEQRRALETLAAQVALALESAARARERAERKSEARFRSLVQNSSDVIAIVDPDTTVRYMTPSVEPVFGYDAEELLGTRLAALVHPEDVARALDACARAAATGELDPALELRLRHRNGAWLSTETVVNPRLGDEDVAGLVLTTRDVTMRKQLEAAQAERERVRDVFARFVPETVVEQLLAETDGDLRLGGETVNGTIMFTDLRGFTSFSESLPAEEVIEVINQFLSEQTDTIMAHGGTLISYLGDGILAAFGAPLEQPDHADRAVAASRELVSDRLPRLNAWMRKRGYGDGFRMGIGLNSGPFISGNVGHERRLEYTAIGDVCNTAARIQDLTKGTRHMLLFSETTRERLASLPDDLVDVGEFPIRGRHAAVRLWSLERVSDPA